MKKFFLLLTALLVLTMILTSCEIFVPDATTELDCAMHVWSEYKYNERGHWREYTCGCPWPETFELHINHDADMLCDVCGAPYECKHVDADENHICEICGYDWNPKAIWCYDKNGHWMIYDSTNGPVPDVVWAEGEHTYEKDGVKCDKCPYCRHIDNDENNSCDVCGDDFPG